MTSTQVMGTRASFMDTLIPVSNTTKSGAGDFKSFLNLQNNKSNLETLSQPVETVKKTDGNKETLQTDKTVETDNTQINQTTDKVREVENDDVKTVKEAVEKIADAIKEELDVTDEDIINALENLGLTPVALLNPENLKILIADVADIENPIEFATNEELLGTLNNLEENLTNVIDEVCEALGMNVEEFSKAVEKFQQVIPEEVTEEVTEEVSVDIKDEATVSNDKVVDIPVKAEEKVTSDKELPVIENEEPLKKNLIKEEKIEVKLHNFSVHSKEEVQTKPVAETSSDSKEELFHEGEQKPSSELLSFAENLIKETVDALNENVEMGSFTTVDAAEIINQITESIKTQISNEATEVNMKLHPESLGNVHVRISANNEGVLTARFIAENESVKNVIEAQAISLKETLESKGVTVEAVEVMVASHKFDESFSRERGKENNSTSSKKTTRRINLDDEDITDGTEADIQAQNLAKEIMRQNGNTIDYTA